MYIFLYDISTICITNIMGSVRKRYPYAVSIYLSADQQIISNNYLPVQVYV